MNYEMIQKNNIQMVFGETKKFHSNTFSFYFLIPFKKEDMMLHECLCNVLKEATNQYPSNELLNAYLEELYGASLYISSVRFGPYLCMTVMVKFLDSRYIEDIENEILELIHNLICNPYLNENGYFQEKIVENQKREMINEIESIQDNKPALSFSRFLETMFPNENISISKYKLIPQVKEITNVKLTEYYRYFIHNSSIFFVSIGNAKKENIIKKISKEFSSIPYDTTNFYKKDFPIYENFTQLNEKDEMNQTRIILGFDLSIDRRSDLYYSLVVARAMLYGSMNSVLFRVIREKYGLCYSINGVSDVYRGFIAITAGIKNENKDIFVEYTLKEIENLKNGKFTKKFIDEVKRGIYNDLEEQEDQSVYLTRRIFQSLLYDTSFEKKEFKSKIQAVTKESIIEVYSMMNYRTLYVRSCNS